MNKSNLWVGAAVVCLAATLPGLTFAWDLTPERDVRPIITESGLVIKLAEAEANDTVSGYCAAYLRRAGKPDSDSAVMSCVHTIGVITRPVYAELNPNLTVKHFSSETMDSDLWWLKPGERFLVPSVDSDGTIAAAALGSDGILDPGDINLAEIISAIDDRLKAAEAAIGEVRGGLTQVTDGVRANRESINTLGGRTRVLEARLDAVETALKGADGKLIPAAETSDKLDATIMAVAELRNGKGEQGEPGYVPGVNAIREALSKDDGSLVDVSAIGADEDGWWNFWGYGWWVAVLLALSAFLFFWARRQSDDNVVRTDEEGRIDSDTLPHDVVTDEKLKDTLDQRLKDIPTKGDLATLIGEEQRDANGQVVARTGLLDSLHRVYERVDDLNGEFNKLGVQVAGAVATAEAALESAETAKDKASDGDDASKVKPSPHNKKLAAGKVGAERNWTYVHEVTGETYSIHLEAVPHRDPKLAQAGEILWQADLPRHKNRMGGKVFPVATDKVDQTIRNAIRDGRLSPDKAANAA